MPLTKRLEAHNNCERCASHASRMFCAMTDGARHQFDAIGDTLAIAGRTTLFREGESSSQVFIVCRGKLKLSTTSKEGKTMILRLAGPGDVLGLSAMLHHQPYEVTAETLEPCEFKAILEQDFAELLKEHGEASSNAAHVLAKEYREVFLDARRLALSGSVAGRLAQLLLDWARTSSHDKPEQRFTMALTHEELANLAGTSRESVTRMLNKFERDHLLLRRGSSIHILQPEQLERLIS